MNWNKHNLIPGDVVELDKNHPNHSEVVIVSMTKSGMFSRVYPAKLKDPKYSDCWDTMTNRLTPIKPNNPMTPQNKLYEAVKNLSDIEIFKWLKEQKFQTEHGDQEYTMMYEIDMPKIFRKFIADFFTAYEQEQPEAIAGEKTIDEILFENHCINGSVDDIQHTILYYNRVVRSMSEYASQQTSAKDKEIAELKENINRLIDAHMGAEKEVAELKEVISELIQVKDWKYKYGKDEHYFKAISIALKNLRKLTRNSFNPFTT